jgi:hypothetical protein
MVGDRERNGVGTTSIEELRDGLFRRSCRGEPTVEDVALTIGSRCRGGDTHRDASDRIGKAESLEIRSDESQPCRSVRRGMGRTHSVVDNRPVSESELERELARPLPSRLQCLTHLRDELVDHEQQPVCLPQDIVRPCTRCARQRARKRAKWSASILCACQPPELDPLRSTPHFDLFPPERSQIPAPFETETGQQRQQTRIHIGDVM